jgi:uncharacterized protein YbjT (DUF2867 family)
MMASKTIHSHKMASNSCFKLQRAHIIDSKGAAIPRGIRIANTDRRRQFPVARANGSDENGILSSLFKSNPFDAIKEGTINLRVGGGGAQSKQSKNQSGFKGKDPMTVFVAGSSGRLGIRVVYELAAAGYKVRAGVRSQDKADAFDDELDDLCSRIGELDRRARSQINLVYCDLQDEESILPAIGNASRVVCAVGAAESEFTNLAAPKLIDYQATETLISIASSCNISQFILVTSLGTGKIGFPAGVLNLFGGILIWKRKAEEALEQSGMPYLIVRPGGMERPKDNHKEKFNVRLSTRDTLFGGTVSRLQVAELITAAVMDPEVAMNKCVEVVAETEAPLTEYGDLLDTMPVEISQDAREQALVTYGALIAQEREVNASIDSLTAELADTRDTIAGLQVALKDARDELKETMKENGQILKEAERIEFEVATLKAEVEEKKLLALAAKTVAQAQQRGLGSGTVLSREEITSIRDSILYPPVEEEEEEEEEVSSKPASQPFFAFGNKPAPMESEMVEEEKSVENSTATSKPVKQDSGLLGSLIGFLEGDGRRVDSDPVQDSETPAADVPEEEPVAEQKVDEKKENDIFASFKNMFGGQEAVFIDDLEQQAEVTKEPKQNVAVEEDAKEQVVVVEEEIVAMNEEASAVVVEEETIAATEEKAKSLFPDIGSLIKPISFPESTEAKPAATTSDVVTAIQNNAGSNAAEAREWINAWRNRTSENVPDNVAQARDWIAAWKQRT